MNRDIAPFPPPLGRHRPSADPEGPPAHKPARVPLYAAAVVAVLLVLMALSGHIGLWIVGIVVGLPVLAALLVLALLAKIADSPGLGVAGTVIIFAAAVVVPYVMSLT